MKNVRLIGVLVVVALLAAACDSEELAPSTSEPESTTTTPSEQPTSTIPFVSGEVVRLDLPRSEATISDADLAAVVASDTAFGFDLLRVSAGEENLMLSPYSVATALSMLYPGARGETAAEIAAVLHLDVDDATLHAVRSHIDTALAAAPPPPREDDTRTPFTIRPANSAWGQGGYSFLDEYLEILAANYGAGLRLLDFIGDAEGSTDTINSWVEDATEDRIENLIPEGVIDNLTRLVLVNAIWFKANWANQFAPESTSPGPFTLSNGEAVSVMMMNGSMRTGYISNDLFTAVRLPYAGDAAMVVAVPTNGSLAELVAQIAPDDIEIEWDDYQVDVTMPSFEFDADIGLKDALEELGMETAFRDPYGPDGADLTGITAVRELFVTDALHKTFIAVDETGTEAAAATALIIGRTSLPQPATFIADQPFLFWIEHTTTGELLFLGQVTDPR